MTVMDCVAPERTADQRLTALEVANRIRTRRAQLKRDLKSGRVNVLDLLADPPGYCETMKLVQLLTAVPQVGPVKANRVLYGCRVSPSKTLGGMTRRQRDEIAKALLRFPAVQARS